MNLSVLPLKAVHKPPSYKKLKSSSIPRIPEAESLFVKGETGAKAGSVGVNKVRRGLKISCKRNMGGRMLQAECLLVQQAGDNIKQEVN